MVTHCAERESTATERAPMSTENQNQMPAATEGCAAAAGYGANDCCPRCNSEMWGWDEIIQFFNCYKCGYHETEAENAARLHTDEMTSTHH